MNRYAILTFAILAYMISNINAQGCQADVVFVIDASDTTRALFGNAVQDAIRTFVLQNQISDTAFRVGVVYVNDVNTSVIPLSGNQGFLTNQINANNALLGGTLRFDLGFNAVNQQLFNTASTRQRVAIIITSSESTGISTAILNVLKNSAQVYAVGLQDTNGRIFYNSNQIRQIDESSVIRQTEIGRLFSTLDTLSLSVCSTASSVCTAQDIAEGVDYLAVPGDCTKFIRCYRRDFGGEPITYVLNCPDGLFYSPSTRTCDRFPDSECYNNQCDLGSTYLYTSVVCGVYYNCTNRQVTTMCCPRNTQFDLTTQRCQPSTPCSVYCGDDPPSAISVCNNDPFPDNDCKYYANVGERSLGNRVEMLCAAGTRYVQADCSCTFATNEICPHFVPTESCLPDVELNFNQNNAVSSSSWIENIGNVQFANQQATFTSLAVQRLNIYRYQAIDYTLPLVIKVIYRDNGLPGQSNMVIASTGSRNTANGLYILAGNGQATIGIRTVNDTNPFQTTVAEPSGSGTWKELVMFYDGYTLSGQLRDRNNPSNRRDFDPVAVSPVVINGERQARKKIRPVAGFMKIGFSDDGGYRGFIGDIDDFKVWKGCLTRTSVNEF